MIVTKFNGGSVASAYGLMQWDYGQMLRIDGADVPDGAEVNYYQGLLSSVDYITNSMSRIPDRMLQNAAEITAYVYIRSPDAGETILTIKLRVEARPRPDNYVLPDYEDYQRLMPEGGEPGQVPVRLPGEAYAAGWGDKADGAKLINGYLQLMSGSREVGERVRIQGETGREVELRNNGTSIQWRYTDSNEWTDLVSLQSLTGPPGATPRLEIKNGNLYAIWPK